MASLVDDLSQRVHSVTIETAWTPPVVIDEPFLPSPTSALVNFLKPKITVVTDFSPEPVVVMPAGDPGTSKWPIVVGALVLGIAAIFAYRRSR